MEGDDVSDGYVLSAWPTRGARSARQGAMIASLGVAVTDDQVAAVERIMASLREDLSKLDAAPAATAQSARS
jgi:hypothetical protein